MKRKVSALVLVMALLCTMIFTGCGSEGDSGDKAGGSSDLKVAIVCSNSGQNDNGYNQSACDGIKELSEKIGCEYK
ncbi:MAG: BMP family ABC transporter substrate-binding protein, partial [Eubacterium sp.]|nr:BMP family ABC transporter substrate-binding protein [Eubacterium sp.]